MLKAIKEFFFGKTKVVEKQPEAPYKVETPVVTNSNPADNVPLVKTEQTTAKAATKKKASPKTAKPKTAKPKAEKAASPAKAKKPRVTKAK